MSDVTVTLPDGSELTVPEGSSVEDVAYEIGPGLGADTVAGVINGDLADKHDEVEDGDEDDAESDFDDAVAEEPFDADGIDDPDASDAFGDDGPEVESDDEADSDAADAAGDDEGFIQPEPVDPEDDARETEANGDATNGRAGAKGGKTNHGTDLAKIVAITQSYPECICWRRPRPSVECPVRAGKRYHSGVAKY